MIGRKKPDWESVRDGVWVDGVLNSIHLCDPRGGKKLYARRDTGSKAPVWYNSLREAKAGRHDVFPGTTKAGKADD